MTSSLRTLTVCWTFALASSSALAQPPPPEPTRVLEAGQAAAHRGFLVDPARMRELRVVLAETLPTCERERDRLEVALVDCKGSPPVRPVPCPPAAPSTWATALPWGAAGVLLGAVLTGTAWALSEAL